MQFYDRRDIYDCDDDRWEWEEESGCYRLMNGDSASSPLPFPIIEREYGPITRGDWTYIIIEADDGREVEGKDLAQVFADAVGMPFDRVYLY